MLSKLHVGGDNPFSFKKFVKKKVNKCSPYQHTYMYMYHTVASQSIRLLKSVPLSLSVCVCVCVCVPQTLPGVGNGCSSSDEEHSFSSSLGATHVPLTPTHHPIASPPPDPSITSTATIVSTCVKNKDKKPTTVSSSQKTFHPQPVSATENSSQKSTSRESHKSNSNKLFGDSDSDSDIFTSSSQGLSSLSFPAHLGPDTVSASAVKVVGVDEGEEEVVESVSVLRLSDSSMDGSVVTSHGQGSSVGVLSTEPQSERLVQQCSQVCLFHLCL